MLRIEPATALASNIVIQKHQIWCNSPSNITQPLFLPFAFHLVFFLVSSYHRKHDYEHDKTSFSVEFRLFVANLQSFRFCWLFSEEHKPQS